MRRATVLWSVLAVAGVTYAASTLSTQTIGLSSEPLSAGSELAPRETATPAATPTQAERRVRQAQRRARRAAQARRRAARRNRAAQPEPTTTAVPSTPPATTEPGDDNG